MKGIWWVLGPGWSRPAGLLPGLQLPEQYEPSWCVPSAKILPIKLLLPVFFIPHYLIGKENSTKGRGCWSNSKAVVGLEAFSPDLKQVGTTREPSSLPCR